MEIERNKKPIGNPIKTRKRIKRSQDEGDDIYMPSENNPSEEGSEDCFPSDYEETGKLEKDQYKLKAIGYKKDSRGKPKQKYQSPTPKTLIQEKMDLSVHPSDSVSQVTDSRINEEKKKKKLELRENLTQYQRSDGKERLQCKLCLIKTYSLNTSSTKNNISQKKIFT